MSSNGIRILVVDDDSLVRRSLCEVLFFEGHSCANTSNGLEALKLLKETPFDIVISDMKMPGMEGTELLKKIKADHPLVSVIMVTGFGSIESAVAAMREGAVDYITKPIIDEEIKFIIKRIADERNILDENKYLKAKLSSTSRQQCHDMIGKNYKMQKIYDLIDLIAETKTTVLITGESGTGKRLVAHAIHDSSPDPADRPFVEVSCGALPETLLESELFGHVKGAFTGAIKDRVGRFESAEGGTIFLDEIDAFTPALQVKLLRVLQDGEYERVGETKTRKASVRIITATNQDLQALICQGKFRNDLYYRLNIISVAIPPLRDRKDDIPLLVEHFIEKHAGQLNKQIHGISDDAVARLMDHDWPGNVRELENAIERACVLAKGSLLGIGDMPDNIVESHAASQASSEAAGVENNGASLKDALKDPEKKIILDALQKCGGNKKEASKLLGINRTTLYKKLSQYGIALNNAKA
ncbi:MAG: sigma-54-dependent Fis family transcriptional regulator [Candidatus Omnitrophica bacterium]|nr:sigma-54-dependent Fis family transcriptional regulator [Candidatus Omnitrophota bacterium]